jgi:hypothetical protein
MFGSRQLPRKKEKAIAALLSTGTIEQAARQAGVCEKTLRNWLAQADFAAAYRGAREQVVEQAVAVLQQASIHAVAALHRNLSCGRPACEISAANSLLAHSIRAIETFDVLSRLAALEEKAAQQGAATHAYNGTTSNGQARGVDR